MRTRSRPPRQHRFRGTPIALAAVPLMALLMGCEAPEGGIEVTEGAAVSGENGLAELNGLRLRNGLRMSNGLNLQRGLSGDLRADSELMSTAEGRSLVSYVVKCALPAGRTLVRSDAQGNRYTFSGLVGVASEWERGSCGQTCQEWMTACLLSLVNTTGTHVPVLMMAEHSAVGFGRSPSYPRQEGAFFGNLFASEPKAYYCAGRDFSASPAPGRIGSNQQDPPYENKYGSGGRCANNCTGSDHPNTGDGWKACSGWNRVITIWRR